MLDTAPLVLQLPIWARIGPIVAFALRRDRSGPVRWVTLGAALSIIAELAERMFEDHRLLALETPAVFSAYLVAICLWQLSDLERAAMRIATLALLVVYSALVIFVPIGTPFGHLGSPIYAALLSLGAAWALIRRAPTLPSTGVAFRTDWVWILGGLLFYGIVRLVSQPLGVALITAQRPDLYQMVWQIRAVCVVVAFVAITIGILTPPARETTA